MNLTGGVKGGAAAMHGPGADFVLAHGEKRLQAEQPVAGVDQEVEPRLRHPRAREVFAPLVPRQLAQLGLELGRERHDLGFFVVRLDRGAQLVEPGSAARGQILLADVGRVQDRLRPEQAELSQGAGRLPPPPPPATPPASAPGAPLSPARAFLRVLSSRRSTTARLARASSPVITSWSRTGSTGPITCTTSGSSKQRITWTTASTSRMCDRN